MSERPPLPTIEEHAALQAQINPTEFTADTHYAATDQGVLQVPELSSSVPLGELYGQPAEGRAIPVQFPDINGEMQTWSVEGKGLDQHGEERVALTRATEEGIIGATVPGEQLKMTREMRKTRLAAMALTAVIPSIPRFEAPAREAYVDPDPIKSPAELRALQQQIKREDDRKRWGPPEATEPAAEVAAPAVTETKQESVVETMTRLKEGLSEDDKLKLFEYSRAKMDQRQAQRDGNGKLAQAYEQDAGQAFLGLSKAAQDISPQYEALFNRM